jgi:hypothetical protein
VSHCAGRVHASDPFYTFMETSGLPRYAPLLGHIVLACFSGCRIFELEGSCFQSVFFFQYWCSSYPIFVHIFNSLVCCRLSQPLPVLNLKRFSSFVQLILFLVLNQRVLSLTYYLLFVIQIKLYRGSLSMSFLAHTLVELALVSFFGFRQSCYSLVTSSILNLLLPTLISIVCSLCEYISSLVRFQLVILLVLFFRFLFLFFLFYF